MWFKQQIQFAILPRVFKGIKLCYKGQYSFKFQLFHQSQQGSRTSAYPYIFSPSPPSQIPTQAPKKQKSTTIIDNNMGHFSTNHFAIQYQNHTEYFNDLCIFKLENKLKRNGSTGRVYLRMEFVSHRMVVQENGKEGKEGDLRGYGVGIRRVSTSVFERTVQINRNGGQLGEFVEIEINDNDYFGALYMYIGSVHLGWKIRDTKLSLCQFLSQDDKQKKRILQSTKTHIKNPIQVGKLLSNLTKQQWPNFSSFHNQTVKKSITQCLRLFSQWKQINEQVEHPESLTNLPDELVFVETLRERQDERIIKQVNDGGKEKGTRMEEIAEEEYIVQYYQVNDVNQLYFAIYHESWSICQHVRALWQKLLRKIKLLNVDQFLTVCQDHINKLESQWKKHCIKFIHFTKPSKSNHPEPYPDQMQPLLKKINSSSSINIQASHILSSQSPRNSLSPSSPITQFSANPSPSLHSSSILSSILSIRQPSVLAFKTWRSSFIPSQKIISQQQYQHPLLIFQNYEHHMPRNKYKRDNGVMGLVVFVHGFKGSQYDLEKASEYVMKYNQNVQILRIRTLENDVDYLIQEMAEIVALEIKRYMSCSISKIQHISIVGYSLGGIIARAALKHIQPLHSKLNLFITFSSPHLGTHITSNSLIKFGIWYLTKLNKNTVLEQLHTCRDLKTSTKSFMKTLSQQHYIGLFKKVVLVSCFEDQFVPHASSRVEENAGFDISSTWENGGIGEIRDGKGESEKNQIVVQSEIYQMSKNIWKNARKIQRVQVWFDNEKKKGTIDRLTGRHSHIEFLDNCSFLKWFFKVYAKQF